MKVRHYREVEGQREVPGVLLRTVISAGDGAPRFAMRIFEVEPGGSTPFHAHWWEHEVFILSGHGAVRGTQGETTLSEGDVVLVLPHEEHCFANKGSDFLRFICVVPLAETPPPAPPQ